MWATCQSVGAKLLLCRTLAPNLRNRIGIGTSTVATQPSNVMAHWTPIPLNM